MVFYKVCTRYKEVNSGRFSLGAINMYLCMCVCVICECTLPTSDATLPGKHCSLMEDRSFVFVSKEHVRVDIWILENLILIITF